MKMSMNAQNRKYEYSTPDRIKFLRSHPRFISRVKMIREKFNVPVSGFTTNLTGGFAWREFMCGEKPDGEELSDEDIVYSSQEIEDFKTEIAKILKYFDLPINARNAIGNFLLFNNFKMNGLWEKVSTEFKKDETGQLYCNLKIRESLNKDEYILLMNCVNFFLDSTKKGSDKPYRCSERDINWYLQLHGLNGERSRSLDYIVAETFGEDFSKQSKDEANLRDVIYRGTKKLEDVLHQSFPPETFDHP